MTAVELINPATEDVIREAQLLSEAESFEQLGCTRTRGAPR